MTTTELIQCDNCRKDIGQEYSKYSNNTRYWTLVPRFSLPDKVTYLVYVEPDKPIDLCPKCFNEKVRKNLDLDPDSLPSL